MADATLTLGYDTDAVRKGAKEVEKSMKEQRKNVESAWAGVGNTIVGAFTFGAIVSGIKSTIDHFSQINDLAARLDVSTESVQRLGHAAESVGTNAEAAIGGLTKMLRALDETDNAKAAEALDRLGLSASKLESMEPDKAIFALGQAFQEAQKKGVGIAPVFDLMGKSAGELIPILRMMQDEMKACFDQPILDQQQIEDLDNMGDKLTELGGMWQTFKGQAITGSIGIGGVIGDFMGAVTTGASSVDAWNRALKILGEEDTKQHEEWKKRNDERQAARDKQKFNRADTIDLDTEKKRQELTDMGLTTAEKLEATYQRIADINTKKEGINRAADPVAAAKLENEMVGIFKVQADLKAKLADEVARAAALEEKQLKSKSALADELEILQAKSHGDKRLANKLERESRVKQEAQKIADETGKPMADAVKLAEKREKLMEHIQKRLHGKIFGGKSHDGLGERSDFHGLKAFAQANARDANGHLLTPIGKGFDKGEPHWVKLLTDDQRARRGIAPRENVADKQLTVAEKMEKHLATLAAD